MTLEFRFSATGSAAATKSDLGNLKITPLGKTIDAKYVENQNAGRLLVISGQVRNDYKHPRSHIQIAGKLFNKEGSVAKSATVYAGNMIPTLDLARLEFTKIKDLLQNKPDSAIPISM